MSRISRFQYLETAHWQDVWEAEGGCSRTWKVNLDQVHIWLGRILTIHLLTHRQIRECHQQGEQRRIIQIIDQLVEMFSNPANPLHVRNGGLIGLAGTAIALGVDIAPYMEKFIEPLLICFTDPETRVRYFSAECLYNIAKVSKGEILVYFNPIFDALSKVRAAT